MTSGMGSSARGLGFHPHAGFDRSRGESCPLYSPMARERRYSCSIPGRRRGLGDGTSARCPSGSCSGPPARHACARRRRQTPDSVVTEYSVSLKWSAKGACLLYCGGIFTETGSGGRGPQPRKFSCLCARYGTRRWFGPSGDLVPSRCTDGRSGCPQRRVRARPL